MSNKPEITATIKFRGVTIEGMTVEELRQLRDLLNELVGPKERVIERREYVPYPYAWPYWSVTTDNQWTWSVSDTVSHTSGEIIITCANSQ